MNMLVRICKHYIKVCFCRELPPLAVRQKLEELLTTYQASYQNKNTYDKLFSALPTIPWVADRLTSCPLPILQPFLQSYLGGGTVGAGWNIMGCGAR